MDARIRAIAAEIREAGGRAWLVGGGVRDHLLARPALDRDVEVYGLPLAELEALLAGHGQVHAVGRSFGVLKLRCPEGEADFSLPRRESKSGRGHRGFVVDLDPGISEAEACARRDFTVNAMLMDPLTEEIRDYHGGREDLAAGVLRHTGPAFAEDPLRAYRLMQLAGRLEMRPAPETAELCREMELGDLAPERVFGEFEKLMLRAARPSLGLEAAAAAGILDFHPELDAMRGCPQDPQWHPEGDVWVHTLMVLDAAAALRRGSRRDDLVLMFAALCHDLGKPPSTRRKQGRIVSPGHADLGVEPTRTFLSRIGAGAELAERVVVLVITHLRPAEFYRVRHEIGDAALRRLATQVDISELVRLARADHLGRSTEDALAGRFEAGDWLLERAAALQVERAAPEPLLKGRHLLERGWEEGPDMGTVLQQAFEAQLEGAFEDLPGALRWLSEEVSPPWRRA